MATIKFSVHVAHACLHALIVVMHTMVIRHVANNLT